MSNLKAISYKLQAQRGYIALMSAIVISFLLLAITISLGFTAFFGRLNVLDSESKERSNALAEACIDSAILDASNGTYSVDKIVNIGSDMCRIISSVNGGSQTTIKTHGCINKSYTNLQAIIDNNSFAIISWDELPNFSLNVNTCP